MASEIIVPKGVFLKNRDFMPFGLIDRLTRQHPWGQELNKLARFGRLQPEHITEAEWGQYLGPHGNNYVHNPEARRGFGQFLAAINHRPYFNPGLTKLLSENPKEIAETMTGISIHDLPEYFIGDYPMGTKPAVLREVEFLIMRQMGFQIFEPVVGKGNSVDLVDRAVNILEDKKHPMTQLFKDFEVVTHVQAAVCALESSQNSVDATTKSHLDWMCAKVITNHIPMLINFSNQYPYVDTFLKTHSGRFNSVFEQIPTWTVAFYDDPQIQQKQVEEFLQAGDRWQSFAERKGWKSPNRPRLSFLPKANTVSAQPALL